MKAVGGQLGRSELKATKPAPGRRSPQSHRTVESGEVSSVLVSPSFRLSRTQIRSILKFRAYVKLHPEIAERITMRLARDKFEKAHAAFFRLVNRQRS